MADALMDLVQKVDDEASFMRFLKVLRENCEASEHDCERRYDDCVPEDHWETRSTKNFLRKMEDWGGGDFGDGQHYGEPILRRVATMLYVGRHLLNEDRPQR
ncbi:MAG TPA: hypothetical protein VEK57_17790 [Thermoanaerobaculia bacterium]|nr:hypothetical protein [Thermoanaerobaculia bacterium]